MWCQKQTKKTGIELRPRRLFDLFEFTSGIVDCKKLMNECLCVVQELARAASASTYQHQAEGDMRRRREEMDERQRAKREDDQMDHMHAARKV